MCAALSARAQNVEVKIKILTSSRVRIEEKFLDAKNSAAGISFLNDYADASELGKRVEDVAAFDAGGEKIEVKKLSAGEYLAAKNPASLAYNVNLETPANSVWTAHISWLKDEQGVLMLEDLLPQRRIETSGKIIFETPAGWKIASAEKLSCDNTYAVENVEKAIFLIGKNWREQAARIDKTNLNLAISGAWQFTDDEAAQMAASILAEYRKIFGEIPTDKAQILILPLAGAASAERWRAETRGRTVTIISGALASKREALQRLHEQLRHEIFHLWIPNAVSLTGNYDWFYEGFTIYEALRTGVWLNQIRFEDYLNTLSRAFDLAKNQNTPLVEMSRRRWTGTNNSVYAKGMIVAFLCDLAMLGQSRGKHSVAEISQKLYRKYHGANSQTDGNAAVIELMNSYPELQPLVRKYVEGNEKIDLAANLKDSGLELAAENGAAKLSVAAKLSGRQKDLLDQLGYNRWRKLLK